jgi:PKD repeat protein
MNYKYIFSLLLLCSVSLSAQTDKFRIFGTVYNTNKETVADWPVLIYSNSTAAPVKLLTDGKGNYEQSFALTPNARTVYKITAAPLSQDAYAKPGEERHDFVICAKSTPGGNPCDGKFDFKVHDNGWVEFHASPEIRGANYYWNFGDGETGEGKDIRHQYKKDGIYVVELIIATPNCKSQYKAKVEIKSIVTPPPPPPVRYENSCCGKVSIGAIGTATNVLSNVFLFSAGGDFRIKEVHWEFGDGNKGTGIDVKHSYQKDGKYLVTATLTGENCKVTLFTWVHVTGVNPPPPAPCNIDFNFAVSSLSAKFLADFKGQRADKLRWDFGDGNYSTDAATSHTYAKAGEYKVTLYASINGTVCQITKVVKVGTRIAPPNNNVAITIYDVGPNPAGDVVTVFIKSDIKARVTLVVTDINNSGLIKQEIELEPGDNQVPLKVGNLRSGTYIVYLYYDNKQISRAKFQKI